MQDQGKRLVIAVALALGVMFLWSNLFHKEEPPKPAAGSAAGAGSSGSSSSGSSTAAAPAPDPLEIEAAKTPRPAAEILTLSFDNVVATFSSHCGGLTGWQLTDPRYERDHTRGQLLPARAQMTVVDEKGATVPAPEEQLARLPDCGAFEVNFASSTFVVPRRAVWRGEQLSKHEVRYTYASEQLEITKTFTVMPEKYLLRMAVKVAARLPAGSEARQQLAVSVYAFQNPAALKEGSSRVAPRVWASSTLREGTVVETPVDKLLEGSRFEAGLQWTGFEHPFLLAAYAPQQLVGERIEKYTSVADGTRGQPRGLMRTDLLFPASTLRNGDSVSRDIVAYLGPKNYDNLNETDAAAGFATGFSHVVDLGWFAFIGRPLLWLLQRFHDAVGNWGIAIILLTILVKALTLYWTTKSMRSMKAMAALAPQMKVLQAKYGDDKQRQQTETMALYKEHGVNPVAGCLPILLQMPIWLALYKMLSNVGELYQQPFISGWINDLTASDPKYVLPVVLVVTMFLQARLQPASVDSTQQKFLQYGMPLMFGVMAFVFPSGLSLYILTNTVLSALHSIYMNKFDKQSLALGEKLKANQEAAAAALAKPAPAAGKGASKAAAPKRVIDVKATDSASEREADASTESADVGGDAARSRPRRKKRRS